MEQVYNVSTTGDQKRTQEYYWVEFKKCVLSNRRQSIDNRNSNMTAFRIYSENKKNKKIKMKSSDGKFYYETNANIPIKKLQKVQK